MEARKERKGKVKRKRERSKRESGRRKEGKWKKLEEQRAITWNGKRKGEKIETSVEIKLLKTLAIKLKTLQVNRNPWR